MLRHTTAEAAQADAAVAAALPGEKDGRETNLLAVVVVFVFVLVVVLFGVCVIIVNNHN